MVEAIAQQNPKAIVFDLTFNERDKDRPESDLAFNDAIRGKHNIFFPYVRRELNKAAYVAKLNAIAPLLGLQTNSRGRYRRQKVPSLVPFGNRAQ